MTSNASVSSNISETTAAIITEGLPRKTSVIPLILRVTFLLILTVFNLCGNGFTLITIRYTPRLWTKTNFILASMLAADITLGVFMFWYTPLFVYVSLFGNQCRYNVLVTATTPLLKIPGYVGIYHLVLISVERFIAIVYPLHYETKFSDRRMKWSIFSAWMTGILVGLSFAFWLINADLRQCVLIPKQYHLVDVFLIYIPVCVSLFTCYGKILVIFCRQRRRIECEPMVITPAPGASLQTATVPTPQRNKAPSNCNAVNLKDHPMAATGPQLNQTVTSYGASFSELTQQQRQKIKSRRRQFKAVYLTSAIVGTFVILWFPTVLSRILSLAGYNPDVVNTIAVAVGAIGAFNFSFSWAIYAAVSKSYRRAYRQMLIRIGCCSCCKNVTVK